MYSNNFDVAINYHSVPDDYDPDEPDQDDDFDDEDDT